ncbi:MAG: hypothetical protein HY735_21805, partial [Verrucomicrobia bacterium]|nr:hypothetical protein [Verrucomicrobiota bacterium]
MVDRSYCWEARGADDAAESVGVAFPLTPALSQGERVKTDLMLEAAREFGMETGAKILVESCAGVKPGEEVLIVTDEERLPIARAVRG